MIKRKYELFFKILNIGYLCCVVEGLENLNQEKELSQLSHPIIFSTCSNVYGMRGHI